MPRSKRQYPIGVFKGQAFKSPLEAKAFSRTLLPLLMSSTLSWTAFGQNIYSENLNLEAQQANSSLEYDSNNGLNRVPQQFNGQLQTQNAVSVTTRVQNEAPTLIQASPLVESRAEALRRSRQDAEISTEQRIVEKLEQSRLEDERRRSEAIFGDRFSNLSERAGYQHPSQVQQPQQAQLPQAVVVVAPPQQEVIKEQVVDREAIRAEILAVQKEEQSQKPVSSDRKSYSRLYLGIPDYSGAANVHGQYSLGISLGQQVQELIDVEASFFYSQFDVEQFGSFGGGAQTCDAFGCFVIPRITQMNKYQLGGSLRYTVLPFTMIRPYVGGAAFYTFRTYTDTQFAIPNNDAQSHAVDLGLVIGSDLQISESFSVGLDYRHMWNLFNRSTNQGIQRSFYSSQFRDPSRIENLSYSNVSLTTKFTF